MLDILMIIIILAAPAGMIWLAKNVKILNFLGAIVLCYLLGILISMITLIPGVEYDKELTSMVTSVLIPIAIPIILFSFNLKSIKGLAKNTTVAFIGIVISVVVASTLAQVILNGSFENSAEYSGMAAGLYTGGTPNLFAVGKALGMSIDKINLANLADMVVGGVYILFLFSFAKPVYKKFLGEKPQALHVSDEESGKLIGEENFSGGECSFKGVKTKKDVGRLAGILLLGIGCFGVAAILAMIVSGNWNIGQIGSNETDANSADMLIIMLTVTTLGIGFSFIKPVRNTKGNYSLGQYLILMFSLALSMSIDVTQLANIFNVLLFFSAVMLSAIALHLLYCKIFKIDCDTALITSTASIYGPAFIPPVANAMKNDQVVVPGLICGIIGYAIGNYIGIGLGNLFLLM